MRVYNEAPNTIEHEGHVFRARRVTEIKGDLNMSHPKLRILAAPKPKAKAAPKAERKDSPTDA